jgi:ATP-dependent helicase HrpB
VADPSTLRFLDAPPGPALAEARALLEELDAITPEGRLTESGKAMRKLALPVRLAHMVAEAARYGRAGEAATLAVLMTERGLGGDSADLDRRLSRFRSEKSPRATAARQLAERVARGASSPLEGEVSPKATEGVGGGTAPSPPPRSASRIDPPHKGEGSGGGAGVLLLNAWPDRVAKARGERGRFVLANGRGAAIDETDPLAGAPYLVVADLQGKAQNARIASAAAVAEEDIRTVLASHLQRRTETTFDTQKRAVRVCETVRLGAIVLAERMLPAPAGADAARAILYALRQHGLALLPWSKEAETLRQRLSWLHRGLGAPWPDVSDEALRASLDNWLLPFLSGEASLAR